jgi:hypothetical protein
MRITRQIRQLKERGEHPARRNRRQCDQLALLQGTFGGVMVVRERGAGGRRFI